MHSLIYLKGIIRQIRLVVSAWNAFTIVNHTSFEPGEAQTNPAILISKGRWIPAKNNIRLKGTKTT
jgi:hypothetical protein